MYSAALRNIFWFSFTNTYFSAGENTHEILIKTQSAKSRFNHLTVAGAGVAIVIFTPAADSRSSKSRTPALSSAPTPVEVGDTIVYFHLRFAQLTFSADIFREYTQPLQAYSWDRESGQYPHPASMP